MSTRTTTTQHCDRCNKKLTWGGSLAIATEEETSGNYWKRLLLRLPADLCKQCAIDILEDALKRVKAGERASAGVEDSKMKKWREM